MRCEHYPRRLPAFQIWQSSALQIILMYLFMKAAKELGGSCRRLPRRSIARAARKKTTPLACLDSTVSVALMGGEWFREDDQFFAFIKASSNALSLG